MNKKYCLGKIVYINKTKITESYILGSSKTIFTKNYLFKCNKCNIEQFKDYPPNQNRDIYKCLQRSK